MLQSHPDKTLQEHVDEVREAASRIWDSHSEALRLTNQDVERWWHWAVTFHDAGKASDAFQHYIPNPDAYRSDPRLKAHTPLSTLVALAYAQEHDWDWQEALAVSAACMGHHSRFKACEDLPNSLLGNEWGEILRNQHASVNWEELSVALRERLVRNEYRVFEQGEYLLDLIDDELHAIGVSAGVRYRLLVQLVFSILLEADKAYLIIDEEDRGQFRAGQNRPLSPKLVTDFIGEKKTDSKINEMRSEVRDVLQQSLDAGGEMPRLATLTLPTGSGKTLLAASWLLTMRQRLQTQIHTPPIVIVLPFLSIIDQTQKEYLDLLPKDAAMIAYHSLSTREHPLFSDDDSKQEAADFFLDTWQGDVIITTFDQFLLALLSPMTKHQMRFHQLTDALIVMDEVQALPFKLWDIVNQSLTQLTQIGNSHVLAMSATQPGFLPEATPLIADVDRFFKHLDRYKLKLNLGSTVTLEDFSCDLLKRLDKLSGQRLLVVMNTRKSARYVRDAIVGSGKEVFFFSADVTPKERLLAIERILESESCIVVSTQCVEAGVDLDMTHVIRDFAPLDSVVQVAGRCNRHGNRATEIVEIVEITGDSGRSFAGRIYDKVLLRLTRQALTEFENVGFIPESEVLSLTAYYFELAREEKETGADVTKRFAHWLEFEEDVQTMLRGEQANQLTFVVIEQAPGLRARLQEVADIKGASNRWEKRRRLRKLASEIALVSVTVYDRSATDAPIDLDAVSEWDPTENFRLLLEGFYQSGRGIDLSGSEGNEEWGICV